MQLLRSSAALEVATRHEKGNWMISSISFRGPFPVPEPTPISLLTQFPSLPFRVERSKVRVSFFQSSKPQSISPPESLLFGGGQNLIHFGPGSGGGGGGYDNNNTLLDSSYITSAALNQQYDSLLAGHHHHNSSSTFQYNPDDPASMAAVMAYDRQMRWVSWRSGRGFKRGQSRSDWFFFSILCEIY